MWKNKYKKSKPLSAWSIFKLLNANGKKSSLKTDIEMICSE